ncbi:MAG: hypothetical protein HRU10_11405 [Opitutales bacterium]|nr:hypothetical protein [Opitutales bacterium]
MPRAFVSKKNSSLSDLFTGLTDHCELEAMKGPWVNGAFVHASPESIATGKISGLTHKGNARWMGLYRRSVFWFQPFFGKDASDQPEKGETILVLWKSGGSYNLALTLSHGSTRAAFDTAGDSFTLMIDQDKGTHAESAEPVLFLARGKNPFSLIRGAMETCSNRFKTFRLREEKTAPEFVDYLGWCTWDAFYKDVSEAKVLKGLRSFSKAGLIPGFMIIDDGWQDVENFRMQSFDANKKFPDGLAPIIEKAKNMGVNLVGVWHTLQGYWQGTDAKGPLAKDYRIRVKRGRVDHFKGWPEQYDATERDMVIAQDIHRFYQDYYTELRSQGVDMTKVDNQGMLEDFCGKTQPRVASYRAYQQAVQGAAATHFEGNLLHCMCNSNDIAFHYATASVWRNSDDFYPDKTISKQGWHILCNGMNAFFSHTFAIPDWDMFQSYHESGLFHAAARAISGGPVYVSDKPGKQNFELIRKLCFDDGTAIRSAVPAVPTEDCLLVDCEHEAFPFKLQTYQDSIGILGVFHTLTRSDDAVEAQKVTGYWGLDDLSEYEGETCAVYSYKSGKIQTVKAGDKHSITLPELGFDILTASPIEHPDSGNEKLAVAPIGLTNKLHPSACMDGWGWSGKKTYGVALKGGGEFTFFSKSKPKSVRVDGADTKFDFDLKKKMGRVNVASDQQTLLEIGF